MEKKPWRGQHNVGLKLEEQHIGAADDTCLVLGRPFVLPVLTCKKKNPVWSRQEFLESISSNGRCGVGLKNGKFYGS